MALRSLKPSNQRGDFINNTRRNVQHCVPCQSRRLERGQFHILNLAQRTRSFLIIKLREPGRVHFPHSSRLRHRGWRGFVFCLALFSGVRIGLPFLIGQLGVDVISRPILFTDLTRRPSLTASLTDSLSSPLSRAYSRMETPINRGLPGPSARRFRRRLPTCSDAARRQAFLKARRSRLGQIQSEKI